MHDHARSVMRYVLAALLIAAGINHFVKPAFYVSIMPTYLPWHAELVFISGVIEIGVGVLLFFPAAGVFGRWSAIALLMAVFPANVHMAMHPELFPQFNPVVMWLRVPFQALLVAWVYWCTQPGRASFVSSRAIGSAA
jgi:uncharacterized membrane protein